MRYAELVLATHPRGQTTEQPFLRDALTALADCAAACAACADACLSEQSVATLIDCIRLDLACATVCEATARLALGASDETLRAILQAQLTACIRACRACEAECRRHAEHYAHCRACADACRACADACERLLQAGGEGRASNGQSVRATN